MGKKIQDDLTAPQIRFCNNYVTVEFFGNGTSAYIDAYEIDVSKRGAYEGARASSSQLLTKPNILKRINLLLDGEGLNDAFIDKQLLFLITQNADFPSKVAAIREYNKLKSRITEKSQIIIKKAGLDKEEENYE